MSEIPRWEDIKNDPNAIKVLDKGYVLLKSVYGADSTVAEAARISYGKGTKTVQDDINLIRYLLRHKHTSPFEQCSATFLVKLPLAIQGQIVRHRTAKQNQYSGRYSEMPDEWYVPEFWRGQSSQNKQGSEGCIEYTPKLYCTGECYSNKTAEEISFDEYHSRLAAGVSREIARLCLPQSTYTATVWQIDLHNMMHFLKLRMDSHAQWEVRQYADAFYKLAKPHFPACFQAFEDYILNAITISAVESKLLKDYILKSGAMGSPSSYGLSKREFDEFMMKIDKIMSV